jgi:hypothetical protein
MVSACPESGFLGRAARLRPTAGAAGQVNAGYSVGKGERKAEITFGDFGAPVSVSAPPAGEVYVPHPHGGTVGSASGRR